MKIFRSVMNAFWGAKNADPAVMHLLATNNPVNTLLECVCGNDVSDSIVNGKLLMRNRQVLTLDEEKILWQAEKYFTSGEVSE